MVEEVAGAVIEVLAEGIEGISSFDPPRRHRKGCWWLVCIFLAVGVIAVIVIALNR